MSGNWDAPTGATRPRAFIASLGRIQALASIGLRQAIRDRILYVLGGFCVVLILGSVVISQLTVGERTRVVMGLGLSATAILSTLTAVFVTINQVSREIERRTIATILSKPVSRWELIAGRYCGMAATLALLVAGMACLHALVVTMIGGYTPELWKAVYLGWIETLLVAAVALFFASFMTTLPAMFVSLAFVVIGHSSWGLSMMADRTTWPVAQWLLRALYAVLPNLELLNVRAAVVWGVPVDATTLGLGTAYGLGYSAVLLVLASALMARRDLT